MTSGLPKTALERIAKTIELAEGLSLIFVTVPADRMPEAAAAVAAAWQSGSRSAIEHLVDRDGPELTSTINRATGEAPIVLVHGFERLDDAARVETEVRLNLLRDTLSGRRVTIVFLIPRSAFESFRRHCPDLFAWRASLEVLTESDIRIPAEVAARRRYLLDLIARDKPHWDYAVEPYVLIEVSGERVPLRSWAENVEFGLMIGAKGSGKTTALRTLAVHLARKGLAESAAIPVLLHARQLAGTLALPLADAASPLLFLVDDLDEVPDAPDAMTRVERLLQEHPGARAIVAAQEHLRVESRCSRGRLAPWTHEQVVEYLRGVLGDEDNRRAEETVASLYERGLSQLLGNAVLVAMIADIVKQGREPSGSATAWLARFVDIRLRNIDFVRSAVLESYSHDDLVNDLGTLAYFMFGRGITSCDVAGIESATSRASLDRAFNARFINRTGPDHFEFLFPALQAYFAARHVASASLHDWTALLQPHLGDPSWHDVIVYAVALRARGTFALDLVHKLWAMAPADERRSQALAAILDAAHEAGIRADEIGKELGEALAVHVSERLESAGVLAKALKRWGRPPPTI